MKALEYAAIYCKEQMAKENPGAHWDSTDVINAFKKGAEWQKERDELTWKDLQKLDIIANELWQDGKYDKNDAQEFYTEVLNEFNNRQEQIKTLNYDN